MRDERTPCERSFASGDGRRRWRYIQVAIPGALAPFVVPGPACVALPLRTVSLPVKAGIVKAVRFRTGKPNGRSALFPTETCRTAQ